MWARLLRRLFPSSSNPLPPEIPPQLSDIRFLNFSSKRSNLSMNVSQMTNKNDKVGKFWVDTLGTGLTH